MRRRPLRSQSQALRQQRSRRQVPSGTPDGSNRHNGRRRRDTRRAAISTASVGRPATVRAASVRAPTIGRPAAIRPAMVGAATVDTAAAIRPSAAMHPAAPVHPAAAVHAAAIAPRCIPPPPWRPPPPPRPPRTCRSSPSSSLSSSSPRAIYFDGLRLRRGEAQECRDGDPPADRSKSFHGILPLWRAEGGRGCLSGRC